jgi:hypothetical protein
VSSVLWEFEGAEGGGTLGDSPVSHADYRSFVKDIFLYNVRMFSTDDPPYTVEKFSDEFFAAWRASEEVTDVLGGWLRFGGPVSFCYINGNHTYEQARRDFENCDEFLRA